jgi:hypothetical protein
MVVTPAEIAFKKPVPGFIVATDGLLLLHVPSGGEHSNVVNDPAHNDVRPVIGEGFGLTIILADVAHGPSV